MSSTGRGCSARSSTRPIPPRAAGGWYRGGGSESLDGADLHVEVFVRASTPAQALELCPKIASAAAYFLGSFTYHLTLTGYIDVPLGNGVTFKNAAFAPVACNAVPIATDPVRATMPNDATAATARLANFLDDYLRQYEWFIGALRDIDPQGAPRITVSTSDNHATAAGRCVRDLATLRVLVPRHTPRADGRRDGNRRPSYLLVV